MDAKTESKVNNDEVQTIWVVRHGDRMDNHDSKWKKQAKHREDTPLSPVGHIQANEVGKSIFGSEEGKNLTTILSSPFLRAMQTALPLSKMSNLKLKLEHSVWETGCRKPPPPHDNEGFPLDTDYKTGFSPTCGERPNEFRPRLAKAAKVVLERFPFGSGNVAIFSHADPVAYLVTELCGTDPTLTGPVIPCSIFKLQRTANEPLFKIVANASVDHLSVLGRTEPCHPIHFFHDWCELFEDMRKRKVVDDSFRWPPKEHEHKLFQKEWKARYTRLIRDGKTKDFPNCGNPEDRKKKKFNCLKCGVESYVRFSLFRSAPPSHIINCWKCKGSFLLTDITKAEAAAKAAAAAK